MKVVLRWLDIAVYLVFAAAAVVAGPRLSSWYVGLALALIGTPFWFLARWQLGASFSVRAEARKLVTWGMYSRFRHPVYVFGGIAWLGVLLAFLGWGALAIGVIIAVVEVGRVRREEQVLEQTFGAEYTAYRAKTWF